MYKRVSNPIRSTADTTDSSPAATVRPPSSSRPYLCTTTSTKIVPGGEKDSNLNYINDAFIPPLCHHSVAIAACSICFSLSVYTGKKKKRAGLQQLVGVHQVNQDREAKTSYSCEFSNCLRPMRHLIQSGRWLTTRKADDI